MKEELAIIKNIDFGNRDLGSPCLWFDVVLINGQALQVIYEKDIFTFVKDSGVYSIKSLEGKPCVVSSDGNIIKFVRFHK